MWKAIKSIGRQSLPSQLSTFSALEFNDFFASNFVAPSPQPDGSDNAADSKFPPNTCRVQVSVDDVYSCLKSLKNKGSGPDDLSPWVLKDCAVYLTPVVTFLINQSLLKGHFPSCLKFANVKPIPKIKNPSNIHDFHPSSLHPALSKVFERVVLSLSLMHI